MKENLEGVPPSQENPGGHWVGPDDLVVPFTPRGCGELAAIIQTEFENQYRMLCCGPRPAWDQVQALFDHLDNML